MEAPGRRRRLRPLKILKILIVVVLAVTLFGVLVQHLWNWLVPGIFGWKPISFVQALGLLVLSRILFGGFHRHTGRSGRRWRNGMGARWAAMSPEERERFRAGLRRGIPCSWNRAEWSAGPGKPEAPAPEQTAS